MPEFVDAELRRQAKIVNFSLIYGKTPLRPFPGPGHLHGPGGQVIEAYFQRFSGFKAFHDRALKEARKNGFVTTLWVAAGHPGDHSKNRMNLPGRGADGHQHHLPGLGRRPDQGGHDQAGAGPFGTAPLGQDAPPGPRRAGFGGGGGEVEKTAALVKETMERAGDLRVPLLVELGWGSNWDEAH